MAYLMIDQLMQHLSSRGIAISGDVQKRQLTNMGYFHGYKGYRFFQTQKKRLPFTSFHEIYELFQYDAALKALMYSQVMFIESAVKNVSINCILEATNSESIQTMMDNVVLSFRNAPISSTLDQRKRFQQNKLNLQKSIQTDLARAYRMNNPKITHFYNHMGYSGVPVWALFEIIMMGDLGFLLSCLTREVRESISRAIGFNLASDTNRELVYKYIYTLKDLRNAIAHNSVVFDARFRNIDPSSAMKQCLMQDVKLPYINFKTIGDYVILICYYLVGLAIEKEEVLSFIDNFIDATIRFQSSVSVSVSSMVVHPDLMMRMSILKNFVEKAYERP